MVKLLIDYVDNHNIILKINEKIINGFTAIMSAIENNNTEIVKFLVDYSNEHNIMLNINDKYEDGRSPLLDYFI